MEEDSENESPNKRNSVIGHGDTNVDVLTGL